MTMKCRVLFLSVIAVFVAAVVTDCKNKEPNGGDGSGVKIESLAFKQSEYSIYENTTDFNLIKALDATPVGITDTARITYTVEPNNIAGVSEDLLMPKGAGTVTVTVTIQGKQATCSVNITETPVTGITLNDMTLDVFEARKIDYTTVPENIPIQRFTLTSSKTSVATIDADGMIIAKKVGWTEIFATLGDLSAHCVVKVKEVPVTSVSLDKTEFTFTAVNQTLQLTATVEPIYASYPEITWISSDASVAEVSNTGLVTCKAGGNATIYAMTNNNKSASCKVSMPTTGTVRDCQGNTYKTVLIGEQWWMAENLKCIIYDTQSGKSSDPPLVNWTIGSKNYYTDATDKANWYSKFDAQNLTDAQVAKFGYAYSWSAATGLTYSNEYKNYDKQQGICPNGWHIPTGTEWITLQKFVNNNAGLLNSTSGWTYEVDNGTDKYGFTALPADMCRTNNDIPNNNGRISYPGAEAVFQTASTNKTGVCLVIFGGYKQATTSQINIVQKDRGEYYAASVRCVKD